MVPSKKITQGKPYAILYALYFPINIHILRVDSFELKRQLPVKIIPENEIYRIRLLTSLLQVREAKTYQEFNMTKKMTQDLIDSLCKS